MDTQMFLSQLDTVAVKGRCTLLSVAMDESTEKAAISGRGQSWSATLKSSLALFSISFGPQRSWLPK